MGRYRISSARTDIDRRIAEHLVVSEKFVLRAIQDCEEFDRTVEDRTERLRARRVGKDLRRVLAVLSDVGRVGGGLDLSSSEKGPIDPIRKIPPEKKIPPQKKIPKEKIQPPPPPPPPPPPSPMAEDEESEI